MRLPPRKKDFLLHHDNGSNKNKQQRKDQHRQPVSSLTTLTLWAGDSTATDSLRQEGRAVGQAQGSGERTRRTGRIPHIEMLALPRSRLIVPNESIVANVPRLRLAIP
jgi:hypothetical protein